MSSPPQTVAVIGTGTIGASWTAFFLSRGFDVLATDPSPRAEAELRDCIKRVWPFMTGIGLAPGARPDRMRFVSSPTEAVRQADFVQENGPERLEIKMPLFAELDAAAPPDVLIASSSSGLKMSEIQRDCAHPERCLIGHPFNPPHLIPLVEVVGGERTSADALERAKDFYAGLGKRVIHVRREIPGHVANRLQAALWREAAHLVAEGVVSVSEVDAAVAFGPGLRWGVMGPNLLFHLGGGRGGIRHFMEHLAGPFSRWWADLGQPELTPELQEKIIRGVLEEAGNDSIPELESRRDRFIAGMLALRNNFEQADPRA